MRRAVAAVLALLGAVLPGLASGVSEADFWRVPTRYIAALGDPGASSGQGAGSWGLWSEDPGPRGVRLDEYSALEAAGGVAPARWTFNGEHWWLEEHGLIMEQPEVPLPPGKYLVTGGREVTAVLTVHPSDGTPGGGRWELDAGATLHDVTHLGCRSARYTPQRPGVACSPANARPDAFPVSPGGAMPAVEGCHKQDYAVLFVIGVAAGD